VPWGGYQPGGPAYAVGGQVIKASASALAQQAQHAPMAASVGRRRPLVSVVGLTLLGLGIFGGAGALVGWLVGGTQKTALVGAVLGLAAPQLASALLSMRVEQEGTTP